MTADRLYRIGELADELGVSTRTLRYYEEIGLVRPSAYSKGGSRRYLDADRDRILRIRELQAVMGFNLQDIGEILQADDRLAELRSEYARGVSPKRHRDILIEAARLNARTQAQVLAKVAVLDGYLAELRQKAGRYREKAGELGIELPGEAVGEAAPV
jgi:DNA-binding transcriptional MerR regulator